MTPAKKQAAKKDGEVSEKQATVAMARGKPLSTRGRRFVGTVVSTRMAKTVTVEWERRKFIPKYQRYEKRRTRVKAHDELGVKMGEMVEIVETRPISKTKHFLVTKRV